MHFGRVCDWLTASLLGAGVRLEGLSIVDGYRILLSLLLTDRAPSLTMYWQGLLKQHGLWREPEPLPDALGAPAAGDTALYRQQDLGSAGEGRRRVRITAGEVQDPLAFKKMWQKSGLVADA